MTNASDNSRFRILCVDDEQAICEVVKLLLQREGYRVETAPDGQAAWEILTSSSHSFDLVISDNDMPRLSGLQLMRKLREYGFAGSLLMFSGSLPSDTVETFSHLHITAVIPKNAPHELLGRVRKIALDRLGRDQPSGNASHHGNS